ncbi:MAG: hypothetical protein HKN58_07115 [Xanthomonadales bacterium]|nr:hypothetical protein [Xanthomonadales bacterium]
MAPRIKQSIVLLLILSWVPAVVADNRTLSGIFDGSESLMASTPVSCDGTEKRFIEVGTIQVSATGTYQVTDAGNFFPFGTTNSGVADVVVIIYQGAFDDAFPATNRVAFVDESESVALNAGNNYIIVVQHWCTEINGAFATVIDGPGNITGAGFTSFSYTNGEFMGGTNTANFPGLGVRRYQASSPMSFFRGGYHFFGDLGSFIGISPVRLFVYEDSFNANDPSDNLVATSGDEITAAILLDANTNYVLVAVDEFDTVNRWQYVLFPPGLFQFNTGMNGAWVPLGIQRQGILMEVFPQLGILFFAHFTFTDALIATQAQSADEQSPDRDDGTTKPQNHLGSVEQIWLTAFGTLPNNSNFIELTYENTTGGAFNSAVPVPDQDSNYGTGWIEAFGCESILVNWDLPGGIVSTVEHTRVAQESIENCYRNIPAGPISPPF